MDNVSLKLVNNSGDWTSNQNTLIFIWQWIGILTLDLILEINALEYFGLFNWVVKSPGIEIFLSFLIGTTLILSHNIEYNSLPGRCHRLQILHIPQLAKQLYQLCWPEVHCLLTSGHCYQTGGFVSRIGRRLWIWQSNCIRWWLATVFQFVFSFTSC